ncbi:hypothetical protein KG091_06120 [Carnobacteriaceae bacterium zg-ZUI78]|nr:hypothetical protein [Carnobacteriaceae bacterium zg-ZUI78]
MKYKFFKSCLVLVTVFFGFSQMNSTFSENTTKDILTEKVDSRDKTKKLSGAFFDVLTKK